MYSSCSVTLLNARRLAGAAEAQTVLYLQAMRKVEHACVQLSRATGVNDVHKHSIKDDLGRTDCMNLSGTLLAKRKVSVHKLNSCSPAL